MPRRRASRSTTRSTPRRLVLRPPLRRAGGPDPHHRAPSASQGGGRPPGVRPAVRLSPGPLGLLLAAVVLVTGSGAVGAVRGVMTGSSRVVRATSIPTPTPPVAFPPSIETLSPYLEQDSCNPVAMPGVVALGDLLRTTYRGTSYGIARACGADGIASEHYEGRAIDWFTSARDPAGAARAKAVLDWLLASDAQGHSYANARRLGVMYVIWNDHIWGSYRAAEGWRAYSTCARHPEPSSDTACHRDHIHISLSWAGAMGRTSFWTGRVAPVDYGPCRAPEFNWAAPYSAARLVPCPDHSPVTAARGASAVAAGLFAASGARLAPGSSGPLVVAVQRALGVVVDGSFGPRSGAAVSAFRIAHGLAAGQVVDDATWRALLAAFSGGRPAPAPAPSPSPSAAATPTAPPTPSPTAPASASPTAAGATGGTGAGPLAPYVSRVLTYGSTGPAVKAVQRLLGVTASGWFGPLTTAAVRAFQRSHRIPTTGNVGPLTWAALSRLATGGPW